MSKGFSLFFLFFMSFYLAFTLVVKAGDINNKIRNSDYCSQYFHYYEQSFGIPNNLLKAISLVETGRWVPEIKSTVPWPWSINNNGKAYYFDNKKDAVSKVKSLIDEGETNIDVGCMQINLKHHGDAFPTIEHAFDPKHNIEYAARFLIGRYKQGSTWKKAVSAYHSYTKSLGDQYLVKVVSMFRKHTKPSPYYKVHVNQSVNYNKSKILHVNQTPLKPGKDSKRLRSPIIVSVN